MFRSSHYNANVFFTSPKLVAEDIITQQKFMEVPIKYPAKLTLRVVLTCIMAATGGLIFGYDHGVSGGVTSMDSFLKKFFPSVYEKESNVKPSSNQYCKFNSQILASYSVSRILRFFSGFLAMETIFCPLL